MKILIIHQVPYRKIDYRQGIDHTQHDVTYIGAPHRMADLPDDLPCQKVVLDADEDLVEGACARLSPADGFEKVLSLSEFGIIEGWHIRNHLGLPGPSLTRTEQVRDKVLMKEALANSSLRTPMFVSEPPAEGPLPWSGRTVLKPRQGASSEGVTIHPTARQALAAYSALPDRVDYQLEEYVEGELLHADGLVKDGELIQLVVSRYLNKPVDFLTGSPLGSHQLPADERHWEFTAQAVSEVGIEEGCLHLEFFETQNGELVFLEIANRLGGAGVVDAHLRHSGVHLPSDEIAIRLGLPRPEPKRATGRFHGWLLFPGHQLPASGGHVITLPDTLRDHPCVDALHVLPSDEALPTEVTYQEWQVPVFLEVSHADSAALRAFMAECVANISVQSARAPVEVAG